MSYLGFKITQVLLEADNPEELDEAIRVVNNCYPVLRGQLEILNQVRK